MDPWWYNLRTKQVEQGAGSPNAERFGPYETKEQAENAMALAAERNEHWTEEDKKWNGIPED